MRPVGSALVGPNAVTQLHAAMCAAGRYALMERVFAAAGHQEWLSSAPEAMIPEAAAADVHRQGWRLANPADAAHLAADAGRRTADYVMENRIPAPVRALLSVLPGMLSEPLLLSAIARHGWTFAGSGDVRILRGGDAALEIRPNPLAGPFGCVWHMAVFTAMWQRFVHPEAQVVETACCSSGAPACRFAVLRPI